MKWICLIFICCLTASACRNDAARQDIKALQRSHAEDAFVRQTLDRRLAAYRNIITAIFWPNNITYPARIPLPSIDQGSTVPVSLEQLRNEVLLAENKLAERCLQSISYKDMRCDRFNPIAGLTSSYVKKGQTITVVIGMCYPDHFDGLKFFADGHPVPIQGNDHMVEYEFVATGTPGKHVVPIRIEYLKPDSTQAILEKNLKYEIAP